MEIDVKRFEDAKEKIIGKDRQRLQIGTLSEKTVHAVLKNYYEPDEDKQEIPIEGMYADIYADGEIIEIQTRSFDRLREKLNRFLPLYKVSVVLPIPDIKWLIWIDEETGEMSDKRKSPKKGNAYQAFREFYKIKPYILNHHHLTNLLFRIMQAKKFLIPFLLQVLLLPLTCYHPIHLNLNLPLVSLTYSDSRNFAIVSPLIYYHGQ